MSLFEFIKFTKKFIKLTINIVEFESSLIRLLINRLLIDVNNYYDNYW